MGPCPTETRECIIILHATQPLSGINTRFFGGGGGGGGTGCAWASRATTKQQQKTDYLCFQGSECNAGSENLE